MVHLVPADLPSGQANDVNVRIETNQGQVTLNYHNNETAWSGTTGFTFSQHRNWPAGVTSYTVSWVQVAGTNYHWQGSVSCRLNTDGDATTFDMPTGVTEIEGWRTGRLTVARGQAAPADVVSVSQGGVEGLSLERLAGGTWSSVKSVAAIDTGNAKVTFPKQGRRGTFKYRLLIPGSESVTGGSTRVFTVRVR